MKNIKITVYITNYNYGLYIEKSINSVLNQDIRNFEILIIDDVISAGTSIKESFNIINSFNAEIVGIVVSIDRKEKGSNQLSAIEEIYEKYQVPVNSIIDLDNIIDFLKKDISNKNILDEMLGYKQKYGV